MLRAWSPVAFLVVFLAVFLGKFLTKFPIEFLGTRPVAHRATLLVSVPAS